MSDDIGILFSLYKMPTGRRIHAMTLVAERAREVGLTSVADFADAAIAADRAILDMERRRQSERNALYGEDAVALDNQLDRSISAFDEYVGMQTRVFAAEHVRAVAATRIRKELLPQGAGAITGLPYVEQHAQVNSMLEHARQPELAESLAALPDARPLLRTIAEINERYGASLAAYSNKPTAVEIKEANRQGQERVYEVASMIIAYFAMTPSADRSGRAHLLDPIYRQNEAIRELRRRRRSPADIDVGDPDDDLELDIQDPEATQM